MYIKRYKQNGIVVIILILVLQFVAGLKIIGQEAENNLVDDAISLMNAERYAEAIKTFDQALSEDPSDTEALLNKALTLYYMQRHMESIEVLDKLIKLDPANKKAWYIRGLVYFELSDFPKSLNDFDKALEIDPDYNVAKTSKCSLLREMGQLDEADACLKGIKK